MMTIKVVDYFIEHLNKEGSSDDECFCFSLAVFFTTDKREVEQLELDEMDYFNIIVGSPTGLCKYFERIIDNSAANVAFCPHLAIAKRFDKSEILNVITDKIQSIRGKTERYLIASAMAYFDWQFQDDLVEMNRLFS
jgi:predicted ATP-grasp superfamily ATP-dependent carboligase